MIVNAIKWLLRQPKRLALWFVSLFKPAAEKQAERDAANAQLVFDRVKKSVVVYDSAYFAGFIEAAKSQLEDFKAAGQWSAASKMEWLIRIANAEKELESVGVTMGISTDLLMEYCRKHKTRVLKLCDIASYERVIPHDIVEAKKKLEPVFQEFLVLYTDHTVKQQVRDTERCGSGERHTNTYNTVHVRRDPILFGMFCEDVRIGKTPVDNERDHRDVIRLIGDRLYLIGSWEDAHCNLTFERMVSEAAEHGLALYNSSVHVDPSKLVAERLDTINSLLSSKPDSKQDIKRASDRLSVMINEAR